MTRIGELATGPGRVYLVGGTSAVLLGWRTATVDVDIKLEPEPPGVFEAIATVKEELDLNVELAAPDEFLPPLPGWRTRSPFIARFGPVDFHHYDFYGQTLAKIERGHLVDCTDAAEMVERGLVDVSRLERLFEQAAPDLPRYPALDPDALRAKVRAFVDAGGKTP